MKQRPSTIKTIIILLMVLNIHCAKQNYINPPQVFTSEASGITINGAQVGGSTELRGRTITQHGHCWSSQNDVPDHNIREGISELGPITNAVDTFFSALTGLASNRTYYVRAYVIADTDTLYGNIISFRTVTAAVQSWRLVNYATNQKQPMARYGHFSFVIGNYLYVGGGIGTSGNYLPDTWQYNMNTRVWTLKEDFPEPRWIGTVSFTVGSKGYVGLGYRPGGDLAANQYSNVIYEYDPAADSWLLKTKVPYDRAFASAAVLNNKLFVIGGFNGSNTTALNSVLEIDVATSRVDARANLPTPAYGHFSFVNNARIFVGGGISAQSTASRKFYEFNPSSNQWATRADLPANSTFGGSFVLNQSGYVFMGFNAQQNAASRNLYRYNAAGNTWQNRLMFPVAGRFNTNLFSYEGKGYVGFGRSDNASFTSFDNIYEYTPD